MSVAEGSRTTMTIGFPSGYACVRRVKIFSRSALETLVVGFEVSVTTANCFAFSRHEKMATKKATLRAFAERHRIAPAIVLFAQAK